MKIYLMSSDSCPGGALGVADGFISKDDVYAGNYDLKQLQLKNKSVLLVDDDIGIRKNFTDRIRDLGATVYAFSSAYGALEKYNEINPDVVISDYRMPGMNGVEFIQKIRELEKRKVTV